ncbi:MAG: aminotransferase class V-fold PLP-dependent enzyme, partial [Miltoncostaeaceae bacterium]
ATTEAGRRALDARARPYEYDAPAVFFDPVDRARDLFAQIIGADAAGVAVVPSVSYAMAVAARNLPFAAGQRVLVLDEQFPSNVYVWRELCERRGGEVITVPRPPDGDWTTAVLQRLGSEVAVAALPHAHWTDGGRVDLESIGERCEQVGAALVVDGSQSIGAVPLDVGRVRPAVVVTGMYKWLLGPYTLGFAWFAPPFREGQPLEFNWAAREGSRDFTRLTDYTPHLAPGARRYDVGQVSNFALMPQAVAALEQILGWGVPRIVARLAGITEALCEISAEAGLGVEPAPHRSPHMIGARIERGDPARIAEALRAGRVHVSLRSGSIRISPHVHVTDADVARFERALASA